MFGVFDPNAAAPDSIVALGEAILGCEKIDETMFVLSHIHHRAGAGGGANSAFMFGVHAKQPPFVAVDEEIMNLLPGEHT
jgi:hypothetical protein